MSKPKLRSFTVTARVNVEVAIDIPAQSLEEAVQKSKELKEEDFITIDGEYYDGAMRIISIYEGGNDCRKGLTE